MNVSDDESLDDRAQDYESVIEFLEAASCGSTIGYSVGRNYRTFDCKVVLSDCNRKIEWNFDAADEYHYKMGLRKIDKAIELLQRFRAGYVKGWKLHKIWKVGYEKREAIRKLKRDAEKKTP